MNDADRGHGKAGGVASKVDLPSKDGPLPWLFADQSFWGMTITQFLGAFNDNLFKQMLLLLFVRVPILPAAVATSAAVSATSNSTLPAASAATAGVAASLASDSGSWAHQDMQWVALLAFALSFVMFSGLAGFISDRYSKRQVVVSSKVAEIVVMALGAICFGIFAAQILQPAMVWVLSLVLLLMGAQSTFFGPGKYGILPEIFRDEDLPLANGLILMTTFLAIIFGAAAAGILMKTWFPTIGFRVHPRLWIAGAIFAGIGLIGTLTSLMIRRVGAARAGLPLDRTILFIPEDVRKQLRSDRPLMQAVIVSSVFWSAAAIVQPAVNAFGRNQLQVDELKTSLLFSLVSIGIAGGSFAAGMISGHRFDTRVMKWGVWGMVACLAVMALPGIGGGHLLGYHGSIPALIVLGFFTGMFAVPLQVFMQSRPPAGIKGRMIATQNLLNWVGILLSAGIYKLVSMVLGMLHWPPSGFFAFTAAVLLPVAIWYRPQSEEL